jgi:hypothetical protein
LFSTEKSFVQLIGIEAKNKLDKLSSSGFGYSVTKNVPPITGDGGPTKNPPNESKK